MSKEKNAYKNKYVHALKNILNIGNNAYGITSIRNSNKKNACNLKLSSIIPPFSIHVSV